ncbi:MAG: hypothetical protein P4L46_00250 [Fimbriimonas sp.]|nr:hypothetical protein [Fimbriimonas sp.]
MRVKHIFPVAIALPLVSLVPVLAGCGGNVTGVASGSGAFARTFTGEIDDRSGGLQSINITVAPDGTVTGSSIGFTVSGTFRRNGTATLITQGGTLTGSFSAPTGTTIYAKMTNSTTHSTVYVILLVSPSSSTAGYMGYQSDTTKKSLVPIAFAIDSKGNLSGTVEVNVNNSMGFANVTGTMDSGGGIQLTEAQNGTTINTVTGSLVQSGLGLGGSIAFGNEDQGAISTQLITQ